MQWENLRATDFEEAVADCGGVCILPLGVLEYHGPHLPLGTDMLRAHRMACDVAAAEPAIVFPPSWRELRIEDLSGGVVITSFSSRFENVCDEISATAFTRSSC